jgi:hypothetical protein
MHSKAALLTLLACLFVPLLPLAAHASTIDDFTLTGGGNVITYSLPATSSYPDFSLFNFFNDPAVGTINGVAGSAIDGAYYDPAFFRNVSIDYTFPGSSLGGLVLVGQPFIDFSFVPATNPPPYLQEDVVPTFVPGTYSLETITGSVPYTLQITQEAATAATPEPAGFILLATGALGLLGIAARRPQPSAASPPVELATRRPAN